jgi:hypothetical protein
MDNKIRFNCVMKASTRKKLHKIALKQGRSDSNMVEYLISSYKLKQEESNVDVVTDEKSGQD